MNDNKPSIFDEPEAPADGAITSDAAPGTPTSRAKEFRAEVSSGGVDLFDHTAEAAAIRSAREDDGVQPPELPATIPVPINNGVLMEDSTGMLKDEVERRFQSEFGGRVVEVSPAEREAFVRSALHDEEMIFHIKMEGVDTVVDVAIPTDSFTTSAAAATKKWGVDGFIDANSDMQWLLSFQQMHVWYQVRAINGEPTPWSDMFADGLPKLSVLRSFINNPDNFETFFSMGTTRWRMLLEAARTAELKYKLCMENWQNRTFFTGAGTA